MRLDRDIQAEMSSAQPATAAAVVPGQPYGFKNEDLRFKGTNKLRTLPHPTRDPDGIRLSLGASASRAAMARLERESRTITGGGRKYLEPKPSQEKPFRPSRKKLEAMKHDDRPQGIKRVPEPRHEEVDRPHGRRPHPDNGKRSENYSLWGGGQDLGCKIRVKREDGTLACERQAYEDQLEAHLGSKVKIDPADVLSTRNGIGSSRPGDKMYSHVDYAPGFFKRHGEVPDGSYPGSNWGTYKRMTPFDETEAAAMSRSSTKALNTAPKLWEVGRPKRKKYAPVPRHLSYDAIRAAEILAKDMDEVAALDKDWEDRTGMYTWASKKKKAAPEDGDADE